MAFLSRLHTFAAPAVAFEDFEGGLHAWSPGPQRLGWLVKQGQLAGL